MTDDDQYFASELAEEAFLKPVRPYDVVFLITSRARPRLLESLLTDLPHLAVALNAAGFSWACAVYAQGYTEGELQALDAACDYPLFLQAAPQEHAVIGEVSALGYPALHHTMQQRVGFGWQDSKLVILLDDDSTLTPGLRLNRNFAQAVRQFIDGQHLFYSVRLGSGTEFYRLTLIDPVWPTMPGREKMQFFAPAVLRQALAHERLASVTSGDDVVLSTQAWLLDPKLCFSVEGMGDFVHLALEGHLSPHVYELVGGLADLPEPLTTVEPSDLYPNLFVAPGHPQFAYHAVRPEVLERMQANGARPLAFELG